MYFMTTDQNYTRRQRAHFIFDENDRVVFSAPRFTDCLDWLIEREQFSVTICHGEKQWGLDIAPI